VLDDGAIDGKLVVWRFTVDGGVLDEGLENAILRREVSEWVRGKGRRGKLR
jgi:hypothetical protein